MTTRKIKIGSIEIGGGLPVALQSMTATKTVNVKASAETCQKLADAGAAVVRIAVDTTADAEALKEIRKLTTANLSVDLQENYRLAGIVAPFVDKIRYNPGHLHHAEPEVPWQSKVEKIAEIAGRYGIALRIGVNCGSLAAGSTALDSAAEHSRFLDSIGFTRYCVSLKSSDPQTVIVLNRQFRQLRPEVPLHLGLTEAGLPPAGIEKTRIALLPLLKEGIGDTLRVSLTVPNECKTEEIEAGRQLLNAVSDDLQEIGNREENFNLISCPSCSRVENERFVQLAEQVRDAVAHFYSVNRETRRCTIAVMGCRVNGPGETDHADFGLWCGADSVNLKKGTVTAGSFTYDEVVGKLLDLMR